MSKKVYVTGGMGGIGTAICQQLAKDGYTVVAGCGPNSPRKDKWLAEQKALGFDFIAFKATFRLGQHQGGLRQGQGRGRRDFRCWSITPVSPRMASSAR